MLDVKELEELELSFAFNKRLLHYFNVQTLVLEGMLFSRFLGYVNAVDIPTGARNVLVQEVKPCPSFLGKAHNFTRSHCN